MEKYLRRQLASRLLYFVVFCESREDAEEVIRILTEWLNERGLTLSPEKTRIVHLSEGFDFLGFNIRHYKDRTTRTGRKLLIKPSKQSVQKVRNRLRDEWLSLRGHDVGAVIRRLNPIIRGWANYFRTGVAKEVFTKLDNWMFNRAVRWVKHTHPHKPKGWQNAKYWGKLNRARQDVWVFGDKRSGVYLTKFKWFRIERHVLVKGHASPDDPQLKGYWAQRNAMKAASLKPGKRQLAIHQQGTCRRCGESLFNGEELHIHHRKPKAEGGEDTYRNLELIHLFCHQQAHS